MKTYLNPMKPFLAALIAIPVTAIAAETSSPTGTTSLKPWSITILRCNVDGKILSESHTPIHTNESGESEFFGVVSINMGSSPSPRLWSVSFNCSGTDGISFQIQDPALVFPSDNGSRFIPVSLFESNTPWQGPGRYTILTLNEETLVAEVGPSGQDQGKPQERPAQQIIELVRTNREGKVIARASTSWPKHLGPKRMWSELALRPTNNDPFLLRLIKCRYDDGLKTMTFRISDVVPISNSPATTSVRSAVTFDVWFPLKSNSP